MSTPVVLVACIASTSELGIMYPSRQDESSTSLVGSERPLPHCVGAGRPIVLVISEIDSIHE